MLDYSLTSNMKIFLFDQVLDRSLNIVPQIMLYALFGNDIIYLALSVPLQIQYEYGHFFNYF